MTVRKLALTSGIVLLACAVLIILGIQISNQLGWISSNNSKDLGILSQVIGNAIALIGLILVFFTIRNQIDSNRLQLESLSADIKNQQAFREVELFSRFLEELRQDINTVTFPVEFRRDKQGPGEQKVIKGKDALEFFVKLFNDDQDHTPLVHHPFFYDLYFIVGSFDTFRNRILKANIPLFEQRHLISRICFLYTSKMMMGLTRLLASSEKGELKIRVETATSIDPAQMLRMILSAHQRMIAFVQEQNV